MSIKIALVGNPNSGKTTLFNALTGLNQSVGNWPGVTVEKKEGKLKGNSDVTITDLPGVYSLSPYSPEEMAARNYLIDERPDVILNIIDGTNIERNLLLTTQLVEMGIPLVAAVNMMDEVDRSGNKVDTAVLAKELGCRALGISALNGSGVAEAAEMAVQAAGGPKTTPRHGFSGCVEHTLAHIEEAVLHNLPQERQRFFAIKLFERDADIVKKLKVTPERAAHIEEDIKRCEEELEDDSESIITAERYKYIDTVVKNCLTKKTGAELSASDRIDKVVTNRWLALPIFAAVMFVVYFVSVTTVGAFATEWANDGVFGGGWHLFGIGSGAYNKAVEDYGAGPAGNEPDPAAFGVWVPGVPVIADGILQSLNCAPWLHSLIVDGVIAGVGAVLGFVPQMFVLFMFLAFLESCGYMSRVAFIMDRAFRRFGLSGKSFIPMLIGSGCGVPGIMASRTIESESARRMTVMTTTFIPCSAKLPIIALIAGALFGGAAWVAPSAYFIGVAAVLCSGLFLKRVKLFAGPAAPFLMELPAYRRPTVGHILRSMWERGWSFIQKAGTIVLLATIVVWFASGYGWDENGFGAVGTKDSILARSGSLFAPLFAPLGWGDWKPVVAAVTGLAAKENVVGTLSILYSADDSADVGSAIAAGFTGLAGFSFLLFNLLCAPCFAAIGAIWREMNSPKWFWFAIGYQCVVAYVVSLLVYQIGMIFVPK